MKYIQSIILDLARISCFDLTLKIRDVRTHVTSCHVTVSIFFLQVAVKVINKRAIAKREYVRKNMRREAVMMQRLAHPCVVQLIEVMETENSFYMVMEYAEGGDFMKYLTDRCAHFR